MAFCAKGFSLYAARVLMIGVGEDLKKEIQDDMVKSLIKALTRFQNKLFEFRSSIERDIGAEDLKQDIFNELKMEEFKKDEDERSK